MASAEFDLLVAFETHSVADIRAILDAGFDVRSRIEGKAVIDHLTEMYSRSDGFADCLRLLLERGAVLDDPRITPVLLDDAEALTRALRGDASLIRHRTSMVSAFTPLIGASLLHVACEYGNMTAARILLEHGADVDARASVDDFGLNGHTPLFHTVNSSHNRSAPLLDLLLTAGATVDVRLQGITPGAGDSRGRPRASTSRRSRTRSWAFCRRCTGGNRTSTPTSGGCWQRRVARFHRSTTSPIAT